MAVLRRSAVRAPVVVDAPAVAAAAAEKAAAVKKDAKRSVASTGVDAKRGFPWVGTALIVLAFLLTGPLSRRAHWFGALVSLEPQKQAPDTSAGLEFDHEMFAVTMKQHASTGSPEIMLLNAARSGDMHHVMGSLRRGAAADTSEDQGGKTALIIATEYGKVEVASLLVRRGANASLAAYDGHTALHVACAKWDVPFVRLLLEAGADKTARDGQGLTPEQAGDFYREITKPSAEAEAEVRRMLHGGRLTDADEL